MVAFWFFFYFFREVGWFDGRFLFRVFGRGFVIRVLRGLKSLFSFSSEVLVSYFLVLEVCENLGICVI